MARILIADDDASLRELARRALVSDGHDVVAAEDGLEALKTVTAGGFDVVVSDLDMPGLDGFGLASQVIARLPSAKILLVSGLSDELKRAEGLPRERVVTLQKPFTLDQLRTQVRNLLGG